MGPSLIQIEHARAVQAEQRHADARPARSARRLAVLPAVVAVAFIAFAFAVVASTASARPIDAPGTPEVARQVASPPHTSAPARSGSVSAATVIRLLGGTVLVVGGGFWLVDALGRRAVPHRVR